MSVEAWLILCVLGVLGLFVVAGFIETLDERRPPAPVAQPLRKVLPLLPPARPGGPWHPEFCLVRGRRVRAARARARSVRLGRTRSVAEAALTTPRRLGA
ncbi:hypothetical protein JHN63_15055 [Streptomyces sp. MBT65]|uniref:hypothetical protein n=1 Tax=Streptomyces sp. MBT65 TaxID=1488395 RepID=UPI001909B26E|nr:hypothetical protein [Streptomyces sp. MBT65]MBK3575106.1 hypothetical protein [Streptomyces sp. MBT65]